MTVDLFRDSRNEWRWRIRADGNHKELAVSSESYIHRQDCIHAIQLLKAGLALAPVLDRTQEPPLYVAT